MFNWWKKKEPTKSKTIEVPTREPDGPPPMILVTYCEVNWFRVTNAAPASNMAMQKFMSELDTIRPQQCGDDLYEPTGILYRRIPKVQGK